MVKFLVALLIAVAASVQAEESQQFTAKQILQRMVKAMELSDYQGTVVFLKNGNLEAMKYFHSFEDNHGKERLVSVNSPQREVVRKSNEVSCLFKATQRLVVDKIPYQHSFIVDVPKNLDELDGTYQFQLSGEEDVAMQPTYIVTIQPRDELRYLRKIWITKAHFLPVKVAIHDLDGGVLEQVVFSDIQVNKAISGFVNEAGDSRFTGKETKLDRQVEPMEFEISTLPAGFKRIFFSREPIHDSAQPVDHLILSDGFASVSIYFEIKNAEASEGSHLPEGINSVGAVNSISRALADNQVTVLGEVPANTVKMIAEGIQLYPAGH